MILTGHIGTSWFSKAKEASDKGIDTIHLFGSKALEKQYQDFFKANFHKGIPYSQNYIPNPFRYQYDLCVHCWLKFFQILKLEVSILRHLAKHEKNEKYNESADEILASKTLYGISRTDFLFAAGELRWPTKIIEGANHGLFIRDPWSESRVNAISDEEIKYVFSFGGGGQGKTHVSLAVSLIIFDHFLFTFKGARVMISTVNKNKMDSVSWSYLCNLNSATNKNVSLYAGRARIAGEWTLKRPGTKDTGGVIKGILIGNKMDSQTIVDKLTGSHGHPFIVYVLDEMQSTPDPPLMAAPNFTMHAGDSRILGSGNWGENGDTLAQNVKPDIGWDKVDENTSKWISTSQNGAKAICLHFNNNNSPGMTDHGNKLFPHLPSRKNLEAKYKPDRRTMKDNGYRRFWVGFRVEGLGDTNVIYDSLITENLASLPLVLEKITHSFFTFDSAPAERDRNIDVIWREGICSVTKQRVFGVSKIQFLKKATESLKYYQESSKEILDIAKKNGINTGGGVVDWTGRPAHAENLQALGFMVHKMVYNKSVPDGIRRDVHTGKIEREIRLNIDLDFKQDLPAEKVCAHHVAENVISLGAWAFREYCKAGRVRGVNPELFKGEGFERPIEEELYNRKYKLKTSAKYGQRFHLEPKDEFKDLYGFSPDILDCFFEAGWYMLVVRKLPLTPIGNDANILEAENDTTDHDDHSEMWELDGVGEFN